MAAGAMHTTAQARKSAKRKKTTGRFHQCWYAIRASDELTPGNLLGRDFLEGRATSIEARAASRPS